MPLCVSQQVPRKIAHQFLQLCIDKLIQVDKSQMLYLERNISFQIQGDDFHTSIRRLSFLVVLGCNALTEMPEYVMNIVIFQIMKNYGNEKVILSVFDLKIAAVAQRSDEFPRTMVVVNVVLHFFYLSPKTVNYKRHMPAFDRNLPAVFGSKAAFRGNLPK
jgi:hypothetical protein